MVSQSIVAYTVDFGNYDTFEPVQWPCICIVDKERELPQGWEVVRKKPKLKDLRRASRYPKFLPSKYFQAEFSIYFDGNIRLKMSPEEIVQRWLIDTDADLAMFPHPQRTCVYQEAKAVLKRGKADPEMIAKQILRYKKAGFPHNFGLTACWLIVRRHVNKMWLLGRTWWDEYCIGSCRDQMSFDYARWKLGVKYVPLPGNLFEKGGSLICFRAPHRGRKW